MKLDVVKEDVINEDLFTPMRKTSGMSPEKTVEDSLQAEIR